MDPGFDDECSYFASNQIFGACSHHGDCIDGVCVCHPGWSGSGDFVNAAGFDCQIYSPLVNNWWFVLGLLYSAHFVYLCVVVRRVTKKKKNLKLVWKNKQLRVLIIGGGFAILRIIEGVHRFNTSAVVGEDFGLTLIHAISGWGFWGFMCPSILLTWMSLVISQSKMAGARGEELKVKMTLMRTRMHNVMWLATLPYFAIFLTYFVNEVKVQIGLQCFYYVAHASLGVVVVNKSALPAAEAILEALNESASHERKGSKSSKDENDSSDEQIKAALTKLSIFVREARKNSMLNTLLCILFAFVPLFFPFASYQLVVGWTSGVIIVQLMLWVLAPNLLTEKSTKRMKVIRRLSPPSTVV